MWQDEVPVANAVANIAFNNDGKVLSFSSSFVKPCKSRKYLDDHEGLLTELIL